MSAETIATEATRMLTHSTVHQVTAELDSVVPPSSGIYAWWSDVEISPGFSGISHPGNPALQLAYVGIGKSLYQRVISWHLGRSRNSSLRRTLGVLLTPAMGFTSRMGPKGKVLLGSPADEDRLTSWMHIHMSVTWWAVPSPDEDFERVVLKTMRPPLNVRNAPKSPARDAVNAAMAAARIAARHQEHARLQAPATSQE